MGGTRLERLRGWTHLQLACAIEKVVLSRHSFEIEEVTSKTLALFAEVHAGGFHTKPEHRLLNQASFAGLVPDGRLKIYVLKAGGMVVAGASMYLASNGVAYLGTAVTRKDARGHGYHRALIFHRIEQAKAWLSLGRRDRAGQLPEPQKSGTCRVNGIPCPSTLPPDRHVKYTAESDRPLLADSWR
ncbi:GNAT family N-acetyltransferase [Pseudomonas sp. 91RF]|uniref:GNAT family N-acetyltransferase n=1 Tax=Pseudomonas sp. 91RF TaxID=2292261 RepID=UPI003556142E